MAGESAADAGVPLIPTYPERHILTADQGIPTFAVALPKERGANSAAAGPAGVSGRRHHMMAVGAGCTSCRVCRPGAHQKNTNTHKQEQTCRTQLPRMRHKLSHLLGVVFGISRSDASRAGLVLKAPPQCPLRAPLLRWFADAPIASRSLGAFDDAEGSLDAVRQGDPRLLVGRTFACHDGLFEAVEDQAADGAAARERSSLSFSSFSVPGAGWRATSIMPSVPVMWSFSRSRVMSPTRGWW